MSFPDITHINVNIMAASPSFEFDRVEIFQGISLHKPHILVDRFALHVSGMK